MSAGLFLACLGGCAVAGAVIGRPAWWARWGVVVWAAGIALAAALGAFRPTGEDNGFGVFVFTGVPTLLWVGAAIAAAGIRSVIRS